VTDRQIAAFVDRTGDRRLDAVQAALTCGTDCGACVTEVVRRPAATPAGPARAA
jgi:bacterioferritin-associated ferredoxin